MATKYEAILALSTLQHPTRPPSGNYSGADAVSLHPGTEDEECEVPWWHEEEFTALEGASL